MAELTHLDDQGQAHMVDVGAKSDTEREAVAAGRVLMRAETLRLLRAGNLPKGDVLGTARVAGIMAAKRTCGADPAVPSAPTDESLGRVCVQRGGRGGGDHRDRTM